MRGMSRRFYFLSRRTNRFLLFKKAIFWIKSNAFFRFFYGDRIIKLLRVTSEASWEGVPLGC